MSEIGFEYEIKISKKARYVRLAVYPEGKCVVTVPHFFDPNLVDRFVKQKANWIIKKLNYFAKYKTVSPKISANEIVKLKARARVLVEERLHYFNQFYNLKWGRVSIRNSKSRWGSCSSKQNLNFSYKLALLPQELSDYVVVHELCHLQEFNHSAKFWDLVDKTIPDHKQRRRQLRYLI